MLNMINLETCKTIEYLLLIDQQVPFLHTRQMTSLIQIQIILVHYNVLHSQTEFDPSYGNPQ